MNINSLVEREDRDRCSAPICRQPSVIVYHAGASPANPRKAVSLCDAHHEEFCAHPDSKHQRNKAEPESAVAPLPGFLFNPGVEEVD